ncbi:MAG: hypothetical protein VXW67_02620 [Bacteroidota bacterium]|nr:hypothetical protein [Bacteroidota bacterium]MEC7944718.1 hypothetical protein [Bacteroidota bacterium]MED5302613.1 hypothetical protein [Bacteroidota bacterium]GIR59516.1 MAG: hypothetical protein CM15mP65_20970 [Crocinitomicaceae bacterium]
MNKGISAVNEIRNYVKGLQNSLTESSENEKKLKSQIEQLGVEKTNLKEEIVKLQEQIKILKLAKQLDGEGVDKTKEVKLMINEMLREIDKCIALMNK